MEKFGLKVSNLYISQVKRKCGIEVGENYNLRKATRRMDCLQADSTSAANLAKLVSQGMSKSEGAEQRFGRSLFCVDRSSSGDTMSGGEGKGNMRCAGAFWDGVVRKI